MPFIIKYMIFSIVGIILLVVVAAIYVAIKNKRK